MITRLNLRMKIAVFMALVAGAVVIHSLVYNRPIRFRPKWSAAPHSLEPLHSSTEKPDNIVLVPSFDMSTSQSIVWRTSPSITDGVVQFARAADYPKIISETDAIMTILTSEELKSNETIHCYSAVMTELLPATTYTYRVGSKKRNLWSEHHTFTTAPESPESFSFVYLSDTQVKPNRVGKMLEAIEKRHPETAFYMIGGDLVDMGDWRNLWDDLLVNVGNVFSHKPVAPAMGNHDYGDRHIGAAIYNAYFSVADHMKKSAKAVSNFSFRYGNAFFIVVNDLDISGQTQWLENELKNAAASDYAFKVIMFHVPVYNTKKGRNNSAAKKQWVPLFDKYKVDLVLTGHDHSYMRSKPLQGGKAVEIGEFGTTYIVATGCDKFYPFEKLDIAETQFTNTATYQMITINAEASGTRQLRYAAYNPYGKVMDEYELIKR